MYELERLKLLVFLKWQTFSKCIWYIAKTYGTPEKQIKDGNTKCWNTTYHWALKLIASSAKIRLLPGIITTEGSNVYNFLIKESDTSLSNYNLE